MAKGAEQSDLEQRLAGSEPGALRVADASRLLAQVLLQHDPRVQRTYSDWLARMARHEQAGEFTEAAALRATFEDSVQLNALVRGLRLDRYQTWLPRMIRWEFQRAAEGASAVEVTVPAGLPWQRPGKRPKQKAGAMGGFRLENLEQHIERFYLCEVRVPAVKKKTLARSQGCEPCDIRHSISRTRLLLDCINAPMPTEGAIS